MYMSVRSCRFVCLFMWVEGFEWVWMCLCVNIVCVYEYVCVCMSVYNIFREGLEFG